MERSFKFCPLCKYPFEDVDIVDGTPLLDIKPYVQEFDIKRAGQIGWLSKRAEKADKMKADGRFAGVE